MDDRKYIHRIDKKHKALIQIVIFRSVILPRECFESNQYKRVLLDTRFTVHTGVQSRKPYQKALTCIYMKLCCISPAAAFSSSLCSVSTEETSV